MGSATPDDRAVFFFDIDNCLYPKSTKVHEAMAELITKFFRDHFNISQDEAEKLHLQYYKDYGLAVEGLSRHHGVAPLYFNNLVDDALPLHDLLTPDPELRKTLESLDPTKVKRWLFTNAHITHGMRTVKLLGVEDLFEGITYCDYTENILTAKPVTKMFQKAEREADISDHSKIYFVDDSHINAKMACKHGWTNAVHLVEPGIPEPEEKACNHQISHLTELLEVFPQLTKSESKAEIEAQSS